MKSKKVSDNTMTYKDVIEDFKNKCNSCCLSDDWLYNQQCPTRETSVMCGEYQYGIVYVRDDAVERSKGYRLEIERDSTKNFRLRDN